MAVSVDIRAIRGPHVYVDSGVGVARCGNVGEEFRDPSGTVQISAGDSTRRPQM
jgi:hypothetical protein